MLNKKIVNITAIRTAVSNSRLLERYVLRQAPDVPVMAETLLRMEMILGGSSISLHEMSQAVLGDLGATLHVFCLAGGESAVGHRPFRIEDCISNLGVEVCIDELSKRVSPPRARREATIEAWAHASSIASFCSYWVEMNLEKVSPVEAYLVGLFHELSALPALLGWDQVAWGASDAPATGLKIATHCALPACVTEYFSAKMSRGLASLWPGVVEMAHRLAGTHSITGATKDNSSLHRNEVSFT